MSLYPRTLYYPYIICTVVVYFTNTIPSNIITKKNDRDHSINRVKANAVEAKSDVKRRYKKRL